MVKKKNKTIAVVINTCFGGFGLSQEAILELYKMNAPGIKVETPKEYFGVDWEEKMADTIKRKAFYGSIIYEGKILADEYDYAHGHLRADPKLVKVVRKMKDKSWGPYAELKIVRIPADVKWEVEEYDGMEHIAECHKTWS